MYIKTTVTPKYLAPIYLKKAPTKGEGRRMREEGGRRREGEGRGGGEKGKERRRKGG